MKKTFLSVAILVIAVLCMTSCENKEKCWQAKITETYTYVNDDGDDELETEEQELWVWGTKEEIDAMSSAYKSSVEEYYNVKEQYLKKYEKIHGEVYDDIFEDYTVNYTVEKFKVSEYDCKNGGLSHPIKDITDVIENYRERTEYYKEEIKNLEE